MTLRRSCPPACRPAQSVSPSPAASLGAPLPGPAHVYGQEGICSKLNEVKPFGPDGDQAPEHISTPRDVGTYKGPEVQPLVPVMAWCEGRDCFGRSQKFDRWIREQR